MGYKKEKDYCSCSPDGLFGVRFNYACYLHDVDYYQQTKTRRQADKLFRQRINAIYRRQNKKVAGFFVSWTYWIGVRLFGWKYWYPTHLNSR